MEEKKLWAHQLEAFNLAKNSTEFALLFEPGLGKTYTCIKILRYKFSAFERVLRTLIVAPLITLENWAREWENYSKLTRSSLAVLTGPTKNRIELFKKYELKTKGNFIAITNFEGLVTNKEFLKVIEEWSPEVIVIDESQRIKNPASKRTKVITKIADRTLFRYILTGTPILNSPLDIFAQWRALDKGKSFGDNFFTFRAKFFYDKNANMPKLTYFPNWIIKPNSYDEINKILKLKSLRAEKSKCLDLPPLIKQKFFVELSAQQKKLYSEMSDHFLTFVGDKSISADIVLTKMLRMLQIISGFVKDDNGNIINLENPRLSALEEILDDLVPHHKILIWAVFKENYEQIRKLLTSKNITFVEAHGEIGASRKFLAVDTFNNDPACSVFLGHPGSLGIGINLIKAAYSIYYNRTHNLEHDIQSEARNYRGGSEIHERITRIDLVAHHTIDEEILNCLDRKIGESEKVLKGIKNYLTAQQINGMKGV